MEDMKKSGLKSFKNVRFDEQNILTWYGLVVPQKLPYNGGAFQVEIHFSSDYPFKPPKITFKTRIYHPNVDEKGQICLPIVAVENWKPATKTEQVSLNEHSTSREVLQILLGFVLAGWRDPS